MSELQEGRADCGLRVCGVFFYSHGGSIVCRPGVCEQIQWGPCAFPCGTYMLVSGQCAGPLLSGGHLGDLLVEVQAGPHRGEPRGVKSERPLNYRLQCEPCLGEKILFLTPW